MTKLCDINAAAREKLPPSVSDKSGIGVHYVDAFIKPFCLQTLPWHFLNHFERQRLVRDGSTRTLYLSDGVVSRVEGGRRTIHHQSKLLVDGDDVFVPALWRKSREAIAYSASGYAARHWMLPHGWHDVTSVDLYAITASGLSALGSTHVFTGQLELTLDAGQAVCVVPAGTSPGVLSANGESSRAT